MAHWSHHCHPPKSQEEARLRGGASEKAGAATGQAASREAGGPDQAPDAGVRSGAPDSQLHLEALGRSPLEFQNRVTASCSLVQPRLQGWNPGAWDHSLLSLPFPHLRQVSNTSCPQKVCLGTEGRTYSVFTQQHGLGRQWKTTQAWAVTARRQRSTQIKTPKYKRNTLKGKAGVYIQTGGHAEERPAGGRNTQAET